MQLGMIGLGRMGANIVRRLVDAGHEAVVYDHSSDPVKAMAKDAPDYISSDCPLAGHHIAQGMAQNALPAATLAHPLSLVRIAYGLE